MTTNPRPRPALKKAPRDGHPAALNEPAPPPVPEPVVEPEVAATPLRLHQQLGSGATSDTLRGKGKKKQKSTLRDSEVVDLTVEISRALRRRLKQGAKAADMSIDDYLASVLESSLPGLDQPEL